MKIVFDLGAVVFRWRPAVLLSQVLPHRAPTPEDAARLAPQFFQFLEGDWAEFDRGTLDVPQLVERIAARLDWAPSEVLAVVDAVADELQPIPGTVDLIQSLRAAGHRLHYLSNMPRPYAVHLTRTHPFAQWFEGGGVFSSDQQIIKPEPALFALAQQRFAVPAGQLLFIDDSPRNVAAAQAAGWQALHFTEPQALRDALRQRGVAGA